MSVSALTVPYMAAYLKAPCGLWFRVCGGEVQTFRDGKKVMFDHLHLRRAP